MFACISVLLSLCLMDVNYRMFFFFLVGWDEDVYVYAEYSYKTTQVRTLFF